MFSKPALWNSYLDSGNILSWKGPTMTIQSKSWPCTGEARMAGCASVLSQAEPSSPVTVAPGHTFPAAADSGGCESLHWCDGSTPAQRKQGTISSHTQSPSHSVFSGKLEFCRLTEWNLSVGLWADTDIAPTSSLLTWWKGVWWEWGCSCLWVLENPSPGSLWKAVCLSAGISEFPLLCFIPQTSTDHYEVNTPIFRTIKRPRNLHGIQKGKTKRNLSA